MNLIALAAVVLALVASPVAAQVGCQPRIDTLDTYAPHGLSFGLGTTFDYPASASQMTVLSLTGAVYTSHGQVLTPTGPAPEQPDAAQFSAWYWANSPHTWEVTRHFGPRADAAINTPLTPGDQWWSAVYSDYATPVLVRWTLHVVVC